MILLRDKPSYGFSTLRDDDFLPRSKPAQQTGVPISQISDACRLHDAS
jgi:hypothetical protein